MSEQKPHDKKIPDFLLEKFRLGELNELDRKRVEAQLQGEASPRLKALEQSDRALLEKFPLRSPRARPRLRARSGWKVALATAAREAGLKF